MCTYVLLFHFPIFPFRFFFSCLAKPLSEFQSFADRPPSFYEICVPVEMKRPSVETFASKEKRNNSALAGGVSLFLTRCHRVQQTAMMGDLFLPAQSLSSHKVTESQHIGSFPGPSRPIVSDLGGPVTSLVLCSLSFLVSRRKLYYPTASRGEYRIATSAGVPIEGNIEKERLARDV